MRFLTAVPARHQMLVIDRHRLVLDRRRTVLLFELPKLSADFGFEFTDVRRGQAHRKFLGQLSTPG